MDSSVSVFPGVLTDGCEKSLSRDCGGGSEDVVADGPESATGSFWGLELRGLYCTNGVKEREDEGVHCMSNMGHTYTNG